MKKLMVLALASSLSLSCAKTIEEKKADISDKLTKIETTIRENPKAYEDIIDNISLSSYQLKLEALKDYKVRQGYIDPKDFLLKFNKYNNSVYLSIYNRKTSENHDLVYVNSKTNLGSFNHRFSSIKDESQFIIYNKTKGLGNIADKISEKWSELRFILTDAF
nr:hypothetical protein [Candidatus Woesearchaeota archaeon]